MIPLLLLLAATSIDPGTIRISAQPQPVWIEQMGSYQSLNFDLIVDNPTDAPLDVDEIKLSVYDRDGSLVLQKLIDGNGT